MGDLISREALLEKVRLQRQDALHGAEITGSTRFKQKATDCKNFMELIESEPAVTDTNVGSKWIPCSERLPEIHGRTSDTVLVCTKKVISTWLFGARMNSGDFVNVVQLKNP